MVDTSELIRREQELAELRSSALAALQQQVNLTPAWALHSWVPDGSAPWRLRPPSHRAFHAVSLLGCYVGGFCTNTA